MDVMTAFRGVAPYLKNPLVLVGFVLFLFFGACQALLSTRIIPQLTPRSGSNRVKDLLRYGFIIALVVIVFGFILEFYKIQRQHDASPNVSVSGSDNVAVGTMTGGVISKGSPIPPPPDASAPSRSEKPP